MWALNLEASVRNFKFEQPDSESLENEWVDKIDRSWNIETKIHVLLLGLQLVFLEQ